VTLAELRERIRRPLLKELEDGAQDRVVVGGLERLVQTLAHPFPELQRLFQGYRDLPPEKRRRVLERALELLEETPASPPGQGLSSGEARLEAPAHLLAPPQSRKKLAELGLHTLRDVLEYYPRRYEDRRALPGVRFLEEGQKATLLVKILKKELIKTPRKGMQIVQALAQDAWGWRITLVWFNQPWVLSKLEEGATLLATGRVQKRGKVQLLVEHFEDEGQESLSTGRIVPVYPAKEGVSQAFIRRTVHKALEVAAIEDPLEAYRARLGLVPRGFAYKHIHFPDSEEDLKRALLRLRFDEYLLLELKALLDAGGMVLGRRFHVEEAWLQSFRSTLPFALTRAQERALGEILKDMQSPRQMARLLQGDVGSGKTVVAALALYVAAQNGVQGALMAPTEILAKQHYENLTRYLFPLGIRVELLLGSLSPKEREAVLRRLATGEAQVVVGTHALIQEGVAFADLGLAVIDEEHRFGVLQRRALLRMAKTPPDVLVMSATPIPRSLALTLYGDLELSTLDELPPGRLPVKTKVLPHRMRHQAYQFARAELEKGHQVFVVAPAIEEAEEGALELKAATALYEELKALFPGVSMGLLHGRMPPEEKDQVMEAFRRGEIQLLVSTTVIEVGVDIPRATVMIVENAERFGLAQLHQLRGRVGRGGLPGYCILLAGEASQKTLRRLKVLESSNDGFYIAEMDLKLRGPGELRGVRQSGYPELRLGDLTEDTDLIERARALAKEILETDPRLEAHPLLRRELQAQAERIGFREVI